MIESTWSAVYEQTPEFVPTDWHKDLALLLIYQRSYFNMDFINQLPSKWQFLFNTLVKNEKTLSYDMFVYRTINDTNYYNTNYDRFTETDEPSYHPLIPTSITDKIHPKLVSENAAELGHNWFGFGMGAGSTLKIGGGQQVPAFAVNINDCSYDGNNILDHLENIRIPSSIINKCEAYLIENLINNPEFTINPNVESPTMFFTRVTEKMPDIANGLFEVILGDGLVGFNDWLLNLSSYILPDPQFEELYATLVAMSYEELIAISGDAGQNIIIPVLLTKDLIRLRGSVDDEDPISAIDVIIAIDIFASLSRLTGKLLNIVGVDDYLLSKMDVINRFYAEDYERFGHIEVDDEYPDDPYWVGELMVFNSLTRPLDPTSKFQTYLKLSNDLIWHSGRPGVLFLLCRTTNYSYLDAHRDDETLWDPMGLLQTIVFRYEYQQHPWITTSTASTYWLDDFDRLLQQWIEGLTNGKLIRPLYFKRTFLVGVSHVSLPEDQLKMVMVFYIGHEDRLAKETFSLSKRIALKITTTNESDGTVETLFNSNIDMIDHTEFGYDHIPYLHEDPEDGTSITVAKMIERTYFRTVVIPFPSRLLNKSVVSIAISEEEYVSGTTAKEPLVWKAMARDFVKW